jgi:hypothetical protein
MQHETIYGNIINILIKNIYRLKKYNNIMQHETIYGNILNILIKNIYRLKNILI